MKRQIPTRNDRAPAPLPTDAPPPPVEPRPRWDAIRRGGRLAFHSVMTVMAVAACVGGECLGNLVFDGGVGLGMKAAEAAVFGVLVGNVLALWLWTQGERGK